MENDEKNDCLRRYLIEEVFEDFNEYKGYLKKALALFQDMQKSRDPKLKDYVPLYLEIEFKNIKSPRLYFPRYKGTIVVQLPDANLGPKKRGTIRTRALIQYSAIVKINELALGDEFAMRLKILTKEKCHVQ